MGLIRGMAKTGAVAGTAAAVAKRVAQRHGGGPAASDAPAAAPAAPAGDDVTAKLNQLSALRESGQLTDEEYAAAKAKVLDL